MPTIEQQRKVEAAFLAMAKSMDPDDLIELDTAANVATVSDVKRIVENAIWKRGGMRELRRVQQAAKAHAQ